jgi:hypothetical protein
MCTRPSQNGGPSQVGTIYGIKSIYPTGKLIRDCNHRGHLYRYHIIHQCQRCKGIFNSDEELDSHIETSERCEPIIAPPFDGITRKIKALLQCKRKAFKGQTEAQRWKQVYQILFPEEEDVPDPCKFSEDRLRQTFRGKVFLFNILEWFYAASGPNSI